MPAPASSSAGAQTISSIETAHEDQIHACELDWYGKRLATCSSDRTVKVFDVEAEGQYHLLDTLRGHDGPVWSLAWGHPKFGNILASAGYDGKVIVWREVAGQGQQGAKWERIKEHGLHGASVNDIAWAPHELGPILACASSDGKVSVLAFNNDGTWDASLFAAHNIGVNSVSWAPSIAPSSLIAPSTANNSNGSSSSPYVKKFATGGCDGLVKIWAFNETSKTWSVEETLEGHTDWVRDVKFAPGIGLPRLYLASAGQDKTVVIWTKDDNPSSGSSGPWQKKLLNPAPYLSQTPAGPIGPQPSPLQENKFPDVVWRVNWSVTGNVLAVSAGDGKVTLWKENIKGGEWECVSELAS